MWKDEIVEATRKAREDYAVKFGFDLDAIFADLKLQEQQNKRKPVSFAGKQPVVIPERKAS